MAASSHIGPRGTPSQVFVATSVALGCVIFSATSAHPALLDAIPFGPVQKSLAKCRDVCDRSAWWSGVRSLSTALVLLWAQSVRIHNVSIVDIFWAVSFVIQSVTFAGHRTAEKAFGARKALVTSLTAAWASRLSTYLWWRNHVSAYGIGAGGSHEDFRYQAFRRAFDKKGLKYWWFSLFQVFGLQGVLSLAVGGPLLSASTNEQPLHFTGWDFAGTVAWVVGYMFEYAGDLDLVAFKSDPSNRGKVLSRGLWAHTRHPNYFGNSLMWWGLWLIACATKGGWKSIYGPTVMTYLLTSVSGASLLEKSLRRSKPGFDAYEKSVPAFVPWKLLGIK
eukprot:TRINITY_DN74202_c0_g1_i1.p1 TRINITY_DN74202_c0_g1~~TRINITY_DN74202_c0_g1_i1.p1  ORF type:complete len:334 (+),score=32.58 TRINITY_DN74202_c0_g1_i1:86-1087(+)